VALQDGGACIRENGVAGDVRLSIRLPQGLPGAVRERMAGAIAAFPSATSPAVGGRSDGEAVEISARSLEALLADLATLEDLAPAEPSGSAYDGLVVRRLEPTRDGRPALDYELTLPSLPRHSPMSEQASAAGCGPYAREGLVIPPRTVCVLVPAHNEEGVIATTLRSLLAVWAPEDIYVFSDGSTDGTVAVARRFVPAANVIDHRENIGKSRGLEYMLREVVFPRGYYYVTVVDADSTVEPRFLRESLKVLRRTDVACVVGQVKSTWDARNLYSVYRTYVYFLVHVVLKRLQSLTNSISVASGCATTWKTRVLKQSELDHGLSTEDIDITLQVHRKRLGAIKYVSSAVVWTQDPLTLPAYRRQSYRWDRAWWEGMRKHRLGRRWLYRRPSGFPIGISVIDIATALLMLDIFLVSVVGLVVLPLLLIYPVDLAFALPLLDRQVDVSSRVAILTLLVWQWLWIVGTALLAAVSARRPRVFLYSPLFLPLLYVDTAVYLWAMFSTIRRLYLPRPKTAAGVVTSAWESPVRRIGG
jgi:cellulose synthase/poly-beta-1,6-N-acetylglucosamine synthase-like glycosyltransferase